MAKPTPHHPLWSASSLRHYLHTVRKQFGLTQSAAAKELGYSTATLNAWERGYCAPDFIQLSEWAGYFELKLAFVPSEEESSHRAGAAQKKRDECLGEQSDEKIRA